MTPATRSENAQNVGVQSNNGTGYRGVHRIHGSRVKLPWKAELTVNGTAHYLGRFLTPEEARDAVQYAVESKDYTRKTPTGRIKSVAEAHGFSLSMLYKIVRGVYLCESPLANKAKEALIAAGVLTS